MIPKTRIPKKYRVRRKGHEGQNVLSVLLPNDLLKIVRKEALIRRQKGQRPFSQASIVEEALTEWIERRRTQNGS